MTLAVLAGVAAVAVVAIALGVVGVESRRLARLPMRPTVVVPDAARWVAERLPAETTARVTYDDVEELITWLVGAVRAAERQGRPVDAGPLAVALARRAAREGRDVTEADAVAVCEATLVYLRHLGALGPVAGR